jgi:hypothetical protein
MNIQEAAANLVERSRSGDQNATASIIVVREEAKKGSARARAAFKALMAYARGHSPASSAFAGDGRRQQLPMPANALSGLLSRHPRVFFAALINARQYQNGLIGAIIALSTQRAFTDSRVAGMASCFESRGDRAAFLYGVRNISATSTMPQPSNPAVSFGRAIGMARAIQNVADGYAPIATISPSAAWELGE